MTGKEVFNRRFKQPYGTANSKAKISGATKIPMVILDGVWDKAAKEYNTKVLNKKQISVGAYAMSQVYSFVNGVHRGGVPESYRNLYLEYMKQKQKNTKK